MPHVTETYVLIHLSFLYAIDVVGVYDSVSSTWSLSNGV